MASAIASLGLLIGMRAPRAGNNTLPDSWPGLQDRPAGPVSYRTSRPHGRDEEGWHMSSTHETSGQIDLSEAARQLEMAAHDARVAASCIGLGDLDEAHTHAILARAAADGAQNLLAAALAAGVDIAS
jgi:hypothetical protein